MEIKTISTKIQIYKIDECDKDKKMLIEKAREACSSAYVPYSHYHVGAAVLLSNGVIVTGSNQENASYPAGSCGERTALFYAGAQYPNETVKTIVIAAFNKGDFAKDVCTPCGICRQVMNEYENKAGHAVNVIMCGRDEIWEVASVKDLLPLSFGAESME